MSTRRKIGERVAEGLKTVKKSSTMRLTPSSLAALLVSLVPVIVCLYRREQVGGAILCWCAGYAAWCHQRKIDVLTKEAQERLQSCSKELKLSFRVGVTNEFITCRVFESESADGDSPLVVALHGRKSSPEIVNEWSGAAAALASEGFRVVVPLFHSSSNTKPGVLKPDGMAALISETILPHFDCEHCVLLGKSWGGGMAARFASENPACVKCLALVAPAEAEKTVASALVMPTLVFWARDDEVCNFSEAATYEKCAPAISMYIVEKGGHSVIAEYTPKLVSFAQQHGKK